MESRQGERLDSLRETGEKLIKDAEYHDATAKGIFDQVNDFGTCWKDVTESIKERKAMVSDVIGHYKVTFIKLLFFVIRLLKRTDTTSLFVLYFCVANLSSRKFLREKC